MNRNKLKAYAPKARRDFIKAMTDRAAFYGLTKDKIEPISEQGDVAIIGGKPFPRDVAKKRKRLEARIRLEGFEPVMEAMAYTWFNRFVAIRYMELHGYLEHGYRVLSTTDYTDGTDGKDKKTVSAVVPDILKYAEHVDLPGLDRGKVVELKLAGNRDEELYRMLLIAQCNALHKAMPFLFESIGDATELLLPENLLHSDSLICKLMSEIPEEEWKEVEIIGWLYQFYISEKKDQVIGKVVKSEDIPAATQLFTPNWVVKYMVQNTLGRQWVATYPNSPLKQQMEYYIEPAEQTPEVQEQLKATTPESLNPEELTLLDPACGSGHILVEAYDLLKAIYLERGYRPKDSPRLILEKNLYGLEIDDRAAQLSAFALMMKAREDDRRIFDNGARPHVLAIQETIGMDSVKMTEALNAPIVKCEPPPREMLFEVMDAARAPLFSRDNLSVKGEISQGDVAKLIALFENGKTFGSLIRVPKEVTEKLPEIKERVEDVLAYGDMFGKAIAKMLIPVVYQAQILARKYDAVVTNPPYMGAKSFSSRYKIFVKRNYPDATQDAYSCFIIRNIELATQFGNSALITIPNWMFLSTFEKLREHVLNKATILSLSHNGRGVWGSDFGSCAFVLKNGSNKSIEGVYRRLFRRQGEVQSNDELSANFLNEVDYPRHLANTDEFLKLPGFSISYWLSKTSRSLLFNYDSLADYADFKQGMSTTDSDRFVRYWQEPSICDINFQRREPFKKGKKDKWFPFNKGGGYRKWYGNQEHIVLYKDNGEELIDLVRSKYPKISDPEFVIKNRTKYFRDGITYTSVSSAHFGVRYLPKGFIFSVAGPMIFLAKAELQFFFLGNLCSRIATMFLQAINPSLGFQGTDVAKLPFNQELIKRTCGSTVQIATRATEIAKADWNSYETSWDFTTFPLLHHNYRQPTLKASYNLLRSSLRNMTLEMQRLEEENNRIFIEAYGLQDEITPEVPISQITLTCNPHYRDGGNKNDEKLEELLRADAIKELISYAIGCMMGRYSLDKPGVIYANSGNQGFDPDQYQSFPADQDGIVPITDTDWFGDDAANRVEEFIGMAWPRENLEENLKFIAENLGPKRGESSRETIRRYICTGFFKHHMKMYKKRPIYWFFASGTLRAFQCLVYLHRYNEGTLSRMRTEYVIPLQGKISARIEQLSGDINAATSTAHRKKVERERDKLVKQQTELQTFDEKLRHYADQRISLDLDDGVKVNYGKFGDLLAEVKAVTGKKKE